MGTILSVWGATPGQLVYALGLSEGGPGDAQYACDPMGARGAPVVADDPIELPAPGIAGYVGVRWAAAG